MDKYINIIIDKINGVVILSYDSHIIGTEELERYQEDIKNIYGYEVMVLANAEVTII